jgi:hypothetical protein
MRQKRAIARKLVLGHRLLFKTTWLPECTLPAGVFRAHDLALANEVRGKARSPAVLAPEQRRISVLLQFSTIVDRERSGDE